MFDAAPVRGRLRLVRDPDDVLSLMDTGAEGVIALVRDAGATFLTPLYHELTGIVCTSGTPRSHIGIVSREFQLPCVMGTVWADGAEPADGSEVELDCSGSEGVVRRPEGSASDEGQSSGKERSDAERDDEHA